MNKKTILIIDTDRSLSASLERIFTLTGANVSVFHDETDGLHALELLRPDLIIVDLGLSTASSLAFMRHIRRITSVPLILIAGINKRDQSRCLDAGADDVVAKPFDMDLFVARVNATLRRTKIQSDQKLYASYDDGHLIFDPVQHVTVVGGNQVRLTPTEFKLMTCLISNAGKSCTFGEILESIWGENFGSNREYVHTFICQLRQKLERNPKKPDYIMNVHGIGYRFQAHRYRELQRLEHA